MTEMPARQTEFATDPEEPGGLNRRYIIIAAVLLVIILVAAILLLVFGLPALRGDAEPTEVPAVASSPSPVPTFTAAPATATTRPPTPTLVPSPTSASPELVMRDTDAPVYEFVSAGARPSSEWTGFFGQVLDAEGDPVAGVSVVVWYRDGQPAADPVETGFDGSYEIHLAEAPLAGGWSVQVLAAGYEPASKLVTFETDEDTVQGIQQIQVMWQEISP
ncbi:MAG: carboxypeptidase regulatory-like domain-containing protein [Anaerolineae bacterium]|nr:carboxypeptidase regulatory-like domain-containing protein [Anaerolineae bacterium]